MLLQCAFVNVLARVPISFKSFVAVTFVALKSVYTSSPGVTSVDIQFTFVGKLTAIDSIPIVTFLAFTLVSSRSIYTLAVW